MAEDTYEYECMRAELLGIEKPSLDEYLSKQKDKEIANVEQEENCTANLRVNLKAFCLIILQKQSSRKRKGKMKT